MPALQVATLDAIRDPILEILRRSDLSSISAKKVRSALDEQADPRFPDQKLLQRLQVNLSDKEHKKDVDELIKQCFDIVSTGNGAAATPASSATPTSNGHSNGGATPRIALPGLGGIPGQHTHADSAAPTASGSSASASQPRTSATSSAPKRARKSDVISDDEEDIDRAALQAKAKKQAASKPKKKRKPTANGDEEVEKKAPNPNNPFNRPVVLSDAMMNVCGDREMPRYMITKKLWAYIKERDLQDPANKRTIVCDDTLQRLFGKDRVDSFEMAKLISPHVSKKVD